MTAFGNLTWIEGRVTNFENASSSPQETWITRLMPVTGLAGLRFDDEEGRFWAETVVRAAGTADKLSFGDQRDTSRIPAGGTPSYAVWDLRLGCALGTATEVDVTLENITDVDYRVHGSGLNMPGFQFILGVTTRF